MIKAAIEKILSLGENSVSTIYDRSYQNGPGGIVPLKPPKAETLAINTITGIMDYGPTDDTMLHIESHKKVNLIDRGFDPEGWLTRSTYITAVHESPVFQFGQFMNVEDFIIQIQAMFVHDDVTEKMLMIIGNLKDDNVANFNDDGTTQAVTAKSGISTVSRVALPNPVTLRPYRTFMEIGQPASTFVFRIQKGNSGPMCALFEADGRMWRLEAIKSIKAWFSEKIPNIKIIA